MITEIVLLWLCSAALLTIGIAAHTRITSIQTNGRATAVGGLGVIRYIGVLCGGVGVIGIPATTAVNPYMHLLSTNGSLLLVAITIIGSFAIAHVGWETLANPAPT